ncbi:MAG: glycine zipper 2TM domain-containing protein [Alphaproteobacteria bacterium]|nr:glycine zipper 2TM domain-containing protein [Alphaproteobacteria bacterium]
MTAIYNKFAILAVAASLTLSGCAGRGEKETAGSLLGGVGGAVAGAQFGKGTGQLAATAAGALLGAFIGSEVGSSLDRADQLHAARASQTAFEQAPVGQAIPWNNPDSGHSGSITPTRTFERAPGSYCREYRQTVHIGRKTQEAYGTACREPDGSWRIVN